jgi:hypothetical protein
MLLIIQNCGGAVKLLFSVTSVYAPGITTKIALAFITKPISVFMGLTAGDTYCTIFLNYAMAIGTRLEEKTGYLINHKPQTYPDLKFKY